MGSFFDMGFKDVVNVGASVLGFASQADGARSTNAANLAIARENRIWQEQMSNTAHQREVRDLLAAGINPILTATGGGGASTPTGSTAVMENPMAGAGEFANSAARLNSVDREQIKINQQLAKKEIEVKDETIGQLKSQQNLNRAQENKAFAEGMAAATYADIAAGKFPAELKLLGSQTSNQLSSASMNSATAAKVLTDRILSQYEVNARKYKNEMEPYGEAYKYGLEIGNDTIDTFWNAMPWKKGYR